MAILLKNGRVDYTTCKASTIYYVVHHKQGLLAPDLEYESNLSLHKSPSNMCSLVLGQIHVSTIFTRKK